VLWRLDGRPVETGELERAARSLDGRGIGKARTWRRSNLGFVHRQHRFTPQDAIERMPVSGGSGLTLAGDLRLNARDELQAALGPSEGSARMMDEPDGALLLRAFERFGPEPAIARLQGDFAVAVWDSAANRLVLARDPLGKRSIFFHRSDRLFAASTRMRALLALPDVPRDLDERAVADWMALNIGPPERTLYRSIDRLPAAHLAVATTDGLRLSRYWDPPVAGSLRLARDEDYLEQAREVLDRAVSDALRASGPVTSMLTGGLDSTNVTVAAARLLAPQRLIAATRVPDRSTPAETAGRFFDETPFAQATAARHPNIDWHRVADDDGDWGERNPQRIFLETGLPYRSSSLPDFNFPIYRFMAARGSTVGICGDFGNAFFSQEGTGLLPELFLKMRWFGLFSHLRAMSRTMGGHPALHFRQQVLRPFEPLSWRQRRLARPPDPWGHHAAINGDLAAELDLRNTLSPSYRVRAGGGSTSVAEYRRWLLEDEVSRDTTSAIRAMSGVDMRAPLADRRVVDFFGSLPLDQFLNGGVTRSIARNLLVGAAPPETVEGRRRGMQGSDWFARATDRRPAMMAQLARLRSSRSVRRIVDLDRLQALLDHWPRDVDAAEARAPEYRHMLGRGLTMAGFLAWHEGGNG